MWPASTSTSSGAEFSVGLAVVSINTAQHESLRATCMTLAVGQVSMGHN